MPRKRGYVWVQSPPTPKFDERQKTEILRTVDEAVKIGERMSKKVNRTAVKGCRVYLYALYEPYQDENTVFTIPLIDGKYFEEIYARITIRDKSLETCELDWQRHNDQWMTVFNGSLADCLAAIEKSEWFNVWES